MAELKWRRSWKPDLECQPWRHLAVQDGKNLYIKTRFTSNSAQVLVTDLGSFWLEELSENALTKRISELNPGIEAPPSRILSHIESTIQADNKVTFSWKNSILSIILNSELVGMPFKFKFVMAKTEENMGKTHLVCPLMSMVGELYRQQSEMFKILAAKDKEIDDYKSQGVKASRRHIVTTPFDPLAFQNNMITSKGFEGEVLAVGTAFTEDGQSLYREIATKKAWLAFQSEPTDAEPTLTAEPTVATVTSTGVPSVESWASRLPMSLVQRQISPTKSSPASSPAPSPTSSIASSTDVSPVKISVATMLMPPLNSEMLRRQALERKLAEEDSKHQEKGKKKKKLKF